MLVFRTVEVHFQHVLEMNASFMFTEIYRALFFYLGTFLILSLCSFWFTSSCSHCIMLFWVPDYNFLVQQYCVYCLASYFNLLLRPAEEVTLDIDVLFYNPTFTTVSLPATGQRSMQPKCCCKRCKWIAGWVSYFFYCSLQPTFGNKSN